MPARVVLVDEGRYKNEIFVVEGGVVLLSKALPDGRRQVVGFRFAGDLIPTVAHLRLGWVMAYDLRPEVTIAEKESVYGRCFDQGLMLAFPHDPKVPGVEIDGTLERPVVSRALEL